MRCVIDVSAARSHAALLPPAFEDAPSRDNIKPAMRYARQETRPSVCDRAASASYHFVVDRLGRSAVAFHHIHGDWLERITE
jgi:hypothetical protein